MRKSIRFAPALLAGLLILSACSDDDDPAVTTAMVPTYTLTFMGSGFTPHVNQTLTAAAVTSAGTAVLPAGTTTVAADGMFSLPLADVLMTGVIYNVDFWIDSNFGGGTAGTCDSPAIDHQWRLAVNGGAVIAGPVTVTDIHNPATIQSVCASFSASASTSGPGTPPPAY